MKKKLAFIAMALSGLALPLAACGTETGSSSLPASSSASSTAVSSSSAPSSSSASSEASSSSSSLDELHSAAQAAAKMLNFETQAGRGLTNRTFPLYPILEYSDQYTFYVNYSIVQQTEYEGAGAILYEDTDPDLLAPDYRCTIKAPIEIPGNPAPWVVFVLTATLLQNAQPAVVGGKYFGYTGEEVYSTSFNIRCDIITYAALKDIPSKSTGDAIATFGYYTGKYANSTDYCWIADGEYGMTAYRPASYSGFAVGDVVKVIGSYSPHSGLPELAAGCTVTKSTVDEAAAAGIALAAPVTLNWDGVYAFKATDYSRQIHCVGTIKSIAENSAKTNCSYVLTVNGADITVYLVYANVTADMKAAWATVAVGDALAVDGWLSIYAPTIEIINPTFARVG